MQRRQFLSRSLAATAGLLALPAALAVAPVPAFAAAPGGALAQAIGGAPVTDLAGAAIGTLAGMLTVTRFVNQGGRLLAVGTLTGTVTDAAGTVVQTLTDVPVTIPVTGATGTCTILTLNLGPLHLDLLGLVVDLSAVNLVITAVAGSGQLLGNLLCAVANLLNGGGPLGALAALLNNILGQL